MSRLSGTSSLNNSGPGGRPNQKIQSSRDELIHNRYRLDEPQGVFPLDNFPISEFNGTASHHQGGHFTIQQHSSAGSGSSGGFGLGSGVSHKYPDFQPWEHSPQEDNLAVNHLQKGFFETPYVANELLSARNIMHQLLRSQSSLEALSSNLLEAIDVRSSNNKIGPSSYKPPPRVTLTDQKRENWLKDLANNDVSLRKLARTIPHGVRNKSLLDQCVLKRIPINRAIWFVRCVGTNELRGLKRKGGANIEFNWIQEWTLQVVEYIEKLSLEYLKYENCANKENNIDMKLWKAKLTYIIRFTANLYMEQLIDKETFKNWISRFFKNCKNFELPLSLTIIKIFWIDILKTDYLIKELTESLLIRYHLINSNKHVLDSKDLNITDQKLNEQIKNKLLKILQNLIIDSFNQSIDNFILPNSWNQLKSIIKSIIIKSNDNNYETSKKFDHISYRNESLMINYSLDSKEQENTLIQILDQNTLIYDFKLIIELIFNESWKNNLKLLIHWSITKFRDGIERIYLIVEIFKNFKQFQKLISHKDIESEVLNIIFNLKNHLNMINFDQLFLLLNELSSSSTTKFFKINIYVRKLISSGLTYLLDNQDEKNLHASILKNLKNGITSQSLLVLKNLDSTFDETFKLQIEKNLEFAKNLINNSIQIEGELDNNSLIFIKSLPMGIKLKLSDYILKNLVDDVNSNTNFSILSRIFDALGDYRCFHNYILKILGGNTLSLDNLESISEFIISFSRLTGLFTNFDRITELFILNYNRISMKYIDLNKFWNLMLGVIKDDKLQIEVKQIINNNKIFKDIDTDFLQKTILESSIEIEFEDFISISNFHNNFQVLIRLIFNGANSNDLIIKRSILTLLKFLKRQNFTEFNKILFIYIKKTYSNANEIFRQEPILDLIVSELVPLNLVVDTFINFQSNIYTTIVKDLLFRDFSEFKNFDYLKFNYLRLQYLQKNQSIVLTLFKNSIEDFTDVLNNNNNNVKNENIQSDSTDILNNFLSDHQHINKSNNSNYKNEFLNFFLQNLIYNQGLVIKIFNIDENDEYRSKFLSILNDALFSESITLSKSTIETEDLSNLIKLISNNINDLNLPVFQLLFKLKMDVVKSNPQLILEFFNSLTENIKNDEGSIGSLFELVDDEMKKKFIHYLENLFLTSKKFPQISIDDTKIPLNLISDNLIKLSKKFEKVELPDELLFALDNSLELLLKIVNKSEFTTDLYDSLGLFLRIIIIHKAFIIDIIVERNSIKETFLNNLVNLLTSKFISQNLPLKNLLYDLLLSFKSNVNEMNISNKSNIVKLPISLINLPAISENSTINHGNQFNSNIHDESIINDLYIYNKSSKTYNELNVKAFDLVEDSNPVENLNDTAINLQLFETSIERKNPA
ncbi:Mediator of RNA polymerase II transcription subunit 12 [Wickerhamomyces ciferrii]|uniref:Mediator of RNA polymerase II transcription subunit 12 n=1 Tax=Wickerhamomyces ciferrii (strain ATCC 14091 / BCRC 22168 / CBS 111 / JCM 3599 / NBRC 0793 / NRRL Y-1031 F-60-10) TaxID=1206466 RepID=K0KZN8_WICCF|nr:Mediator of RNA polymerase II transcription subunit 12 [Wickerhamomyces ciferrii]CCH46784.1 Mediator of RNA polymerase II transcription subunit 12 [Wickerhamomyces ciferrii]